MKRMLGVLFGLLMMGVPAGPALANFHPGDPGIGYVEVCKAANPDLIGNFEFAITDGRTQTVVVPIGYCSDPIAVQVGTVTVEELGSLSGLATSGAIDPNPHSEFLSATATAIGPVGPIVPAPVGSSGFKYTVPVPQSLVNNTNVVTITFSDQLVTGVIEVCKEVVPNTGLTGSYHFTITGSNGFAPPEITVPIGACSPAITVPAGNVKVVETGDAAQNVVAITAVMPASNTDMVVGPNSHSPKYDLASGTVVAAVTAGDATKQTLVTFTNDPVRLKVCKAWDSRSGTDPKPAGGYPFSFAATASPITGSIAPVSIPAGTHDDPICTMVGTFRPGTVVGITEGVVPGTKVGGIGVNVSSRIAVPANLANRTISVTLGPGETVVTYTDIAADPGVLKVCKAAGAGVTSGSYSFTVGTKTVSVPVGSCVQVKPNAAGTYPFNSTQTVVESSVAGTAVTAIGVNPASRLVSANLATRTASVLIGENDVTEVTFTNSASPGAGASGGGGGSSSSAVDTVASESITSANTAVVSPTAVVTPLGVSIVSTTKATTVKTTKNAAKIVKLQKQLRTVQALRHNLVAKRAALNTTAARRAATVRINAVKLHEQQLLKSIRLLRR